MEQLKHTAVMSCFQFVILSAATRSQRNVHSFRVQMPQETLRTCFVVDSCMRVGRRIDNCRKNNAFEINACM